MVCSDNLSLEIGPHRLLLSLDLSRVYFTHFSLLLQTCPLHFSIRCINFNAFSDLPLSLFTHMYHCRCFFRFISSTYRHGISLHFKSRSKARLLEQTYHNTSNTDLSIHFKDRSIASLHVQIYRYTSCTDLSLHYMYRSIDTLHVQTYRYTTCTDLSIHFM